MKVTFLIPMQGMVDTFLPNKTYDLKDDLALRLIANGTVKRTVELDKKESDLIDEVAFLKNALKKAEEKSKKLSKKK